MRTDSESVRAFVKDLGDQVKASKLLMYRIPSDQFGTPGYTQTVYVDGVNVSKQEPYIIEGFRYEDVSIRGGMVKDQKTVVQFPARYAWNLLALDVIETYTGAEGLEVDRKNMAERVRVKKDLEAVHGAAMEGKYTEDPPPPPPQSVMDVNEWLRRQMGGSDEHEGEGDEERA